MSSLFNDSQPFASRVLLLTELLPYHRARAPLIRPGPIATSLKSLNTFRTVVLPAQTTLAEVLRHYHILAPNAPDMIELNDELLQEFELIPQGIPALYAYSERHAKDPTPTEELMQDMEAALLNQRLHSTFGKRSLAEVVMVRFVRSSW